MARSAPEFGTLTTGGRAPPSLTLQAFSAYRAALDREECASHAYADLLAPVAAGKRPIGALFARTGKAKAF